MIANHFLLLRGRSCRSQGVRRVYFATSEIASRVTLLSTSLERSHITSIESSAGRVANLRCYDLAERHSMS